MRRFFELMFAVLVTSLFLPVEPSVAFNGTPFVSQNIWVFLHIFGAILFVGNIIVSAVWMTQARRTRDKAVLHSATRTVIRADWLFTLPGFLLILISGVIIVGSFGGFPGPSWVELSLALLFLTGVIWLGFLVRYQKKLARISTEAVELGTGLSDDFFRVLGRWFMWGGLATLLPVISLYLMVTRPILWG